VGLKAGSGPPSCCNSLLHYELRPPICSRVFVVSSLGGFEFSRLLTEQGCFLEFCVAVFNRYFLQIELISLDSHSSYSLLKKCSHEKNIFYCYWLLFQDRLRSFSHITLPSLPVWHSAVPQANSWPDQTWNQSDSEAVPRGKDGPANLYFYFYREETLQIFHFFL